MFCESIINVSFYCLLIIMGEGKFFIEWGQFEADSSERFKKLVGKEDFSDVTLVATDGKRIFGHQVILATGCSFFRNLLEREKSPKPLIFLRGVEASLILSLMDFLYTGKAEVSEELLTKFIALAEDLGVEGLAADSTSEKGGDIDDKECLKETLYNTKQIPILENLSSVKASKSILKESKSEKNNHKSEKDTLQFANAVNIIVPEKGEDGLYHCNFCDKTITFRKNFRRHVEIRHTNPVKQNEAKPDDFVPVPEKGVDGVFQCQHCEITIKQRNNFRRHVKNSHMKDIDSTLAAV